MNYMNQHHLVLAHFRIPEAEREAHLNVDCNVAANGAGSYYVMSERAKATYAAIYRSLSLDERLEAGA